MCFLRNCIVSCFYSLVAPNLAVLALRTTLILFLRQVTAVKTVKTHSAVTRNYKMQNILSSFDESHCKYCLYLYGIKLDSYDV